MEWKPFESAPKDGTDVILAGRYRAVVAWWGDLEPPDTFSDAPHEPHMCWLTSWDCKNGPVFLRLDYLEPTHWARIDLPTAKCGCGMAAGHIGACSSGPLHA